MQEVYSDTDYIGGELGGGKWMRQGPYKALTVPAPYGTGEWQLYNLADDPGETENLAQKQPDKMKELINAWERYADEVGVILSE